VPGPLVLLPIAFSSGSIINKILLPSDIVHSFPVNSQPLYDVPPDVPGRVLLSDAVEEEAHVEVIPQSKLTNNTKSKFKDFDYNVIQNSLCKNIKVCKNKYQS